MDDLQKVVEILAEAWTKIGTTIKELADALTEAFGFSTPEKERKKNLSSPDRYGMSLKKLQRNSFVKRYSYRPIARKHLPYQRRNY